MFQILSIFPQDMEDALTDPINSTSDQSTATLFPRLPYKLPTALITATVAGLAMRMGGFGINDDFSLLGIDGKLYVHNNHPIDIQYLKYHRNFHEL